MKKLLAITLTVIVMISCSQDVDKELFESKSLNQKSQVTSAILSQDEDFLLLTQLSLSYLNQKIDYDKLQYFMNRQNLTETELQEYLNALGFEDELAFYMFLSQIDELNERLDNKYNLSNFTNEEKSALMAAALSDTSFIKNNCAQKLRACKTTALGTYMAAASGCGLAGLGVSAGWATPVAAILTVACVAGARITYEGNVDTCNYNYEDCMGTA